MIDLIGRRALVTGGSRGIGAATCRLLAAAGADVAVHYGRARDAAEHVASDVKAAGGSAPVLQADLEDLDAAAALADSAATALGGLDIVIHNAGVWLHHPLERMTADDWRRTMRINLDAVYAVTRASLPHLRRSPNAAVVNVVSTAAQRGEPEYADYAASKAALVGWTKSLAVELAPGIRVNAVAPGWVETDMTHEALHVAGRIDEVRSAIPRGRVAEPNDIAGPIVFLVSDLAAHVTGEVLNVNGGSVRCG